jgi:hypothetical protein
VLLADVPRTWWLDAATGDDDKGDGFEDAPLSSPAAALFNAWPGDVISLRSGVYPGRCDVGER